MSLHDSDSGVNGTPPNLERVVRTLVAECWRGLLGGIVELLDAGHSLEDAIRHAAELADDGGDA